MAYQIHGGSNTINGSVDNVQIHGGATYIYGNVSNLRQIGGVIYDHRKADKIQIVSDQMSNQERARLYLRISKLEKQLTRSQLECERLRKKLQESNQDEQEPCDDVLVQRINQLQNELKAERIAHRKEVDELKWRLEAVTDIANGHNAIEYEELQERRLRNSINDDTLDVLFTLINEYPIATDSCMAEELGITETTLRYIAKVLHLAKSPEQRREARERLKRHGEDLIERRGGDTTKGKKKPKSKKSKK